jgi:hypothetical protein
MPTYQKIHTHTDIPLAILPELLYEAHVSNVHNLDIEDINDWMAEKTMYNGGDCQYIFIW